MKLPNQDGKIQLHKVDVKCQLTIARFLMLFSNILVIDMSMRCYYNKSRLQDDFNFCEAYYKVEELFDHIKVHFQKFPFCYKEDKF
jgi:hypothetical protein